MASNQSDDDTTIGRALSKANIYTKLPSGLHRIRLLQLHPAGDPSDEIQCTLKEHLLLSAPEYKALSYAWNEDNQSYHSSENSVDELLRRESRVNVSAERSGTVMQDTVTVSKSLALALRRLRLTKDYVLLWIDSLCINQADDDERTSQVGMMGMIYQSAAEVIIWLGEREVEDELGEWLQGIYQRTVVYNDWKDDQKSQALVQRYIDSYETLRATYTGPMSQKRDVYGAFCLVWLLSQGKKSHDIPFYHAKSFTNRFRMDWATQVSEGLRAVMQQNWWHRAWVVQETVLARKATIVYSTLSAPWLMFAEAATLYLQEQLAEDIEQRGYFQGLASSFATGSVQSHGRTGDALSDFCGTVLSIETTRKEWALQKPVELLTYLRRFRSRRATDERDKVFSLLGMVDRWMTIPFNINYKMAKDELYLLTTSHIIEETQSLSILCDIDQGDAQAHVINGTNLRRPPQLSWITDWSRVSADASLEQERLSRNEHYSAGQRQGRAHVHNNQILETRGYIVGKIARVAPSVPQDAIERLRQTILNWEVWWDQNTVPDHQIPAFIETVCGGLLYKPQSGELLNTRQNPYTKAGCEEIQQAYDAWMTDTTTKRNRQTAIFADFVTCSFTESKATTQLKNSFYYSVRSATVSRRFFVFHSTIQGLSHSFAQQPYSSDIGVGPPNVEPDDIIFVPHCSKVPLILRPKPAAQEKRSSFRAKFSSKHDFSHEKRRLIGPGDKTPKRCDEEHPLHTLIGDAYVNGYMNSWDVQRKKPKLATMYIV